MADSSNEFRDMEITRSDFPSDFIFGVATSAYQIEGAATEGGRGQSIWDTFTIKHPEKISDGSNGNLACDSYHRTKEDVKLMKKLGVTAYRFSISWSRILPHGTISMGVNQEGIDYYNDLIDELVNNGIEPWVTLLHFDNPQALEDAYGGFLSANIVADFANYAELCFWEFGDRVKYWMTINEPWTLAAAGYAMGYYAPGRGLADATAHVAGTNPFEGAQPMGYTNCTSGNPGTEPYIVAHNQLLAHAAAVDVYRRKFKHQKGKIGFTLVMQWYEPLDANNLEDQDAAERANDFMYGWFMEPITSGKYPENMRKLVGSRLPEFSQQEIDLVKGSCDFVGVNYATSRYTTNDTSPPPETLNYMTDHRVIYSYGRDGVLIGPEAGSPWLHIYPRGLYELLKLLKEKYNDPVIYITENGVDEKADPTKTLAEARIDQMRIDYHHDHLVAVQKAICDGVNVKGYFAWSLLDNFEWAEGYGVRFGLFFVDFKNGITRYPKESALWLREFLHSRGEK